MEQTIKTLARLYSHATCFLVNKLHRDRLLKKHKNIFTSILIVTITLVMTFSLVISIEDDVLIPERPNVAIINVYEPSEPFIAPVFKDTITSRELSELLKSKHRID